MRTFSIILLAACLICIGFLIGVLAIDSVNEAEPAVTRTEVTVLPEYRSLALNNRYIGTVTEQHERVLHSTQSGTITELFGSDVADGAAILELNAVPYIAAVSDSPFWRDLNLGAVGPDVENLERFLSRLGYLAQTEIDPTYNTETELAVEIWRQHMSIPSEFSPGPLTLLAIPPGKQLRFETDKDVGDTLFEHDLIGRIVGVERSILVSIPIADLAEIEPPTSVDWRLPGTTISGSGNLVALDEEITVADSGLLVQTGNVEIDDSELSRLMPVGSPLEVRVTTAQRENVLTVPVGLLAADASGQPALLVSNGDSNPMLIGVEVGLVAEGYAEILAGIGPETQILVPLQ